MTKEIACCAWLLVGGLLAAAGAGIAHATEPTWVDLRQFEPVDGNIAAGKQSSAVCAACHGAQGIAVVPTFPGLAGQPAGYLAVQLQGYADGWREDPVMQGQATALSANDIANLAAYFAAQPAPPAGTANQNSTGADLFRQGDPERGIPACQGCHGVSGRGPEPDLADTAPESPWHTWPSLAGLPADYVAKRLQWYQSDAGLATSNAQIMHGVTSNLNEADIKELAAYVSSL